jgi:hypothetical protein
MMIMWGLILALFDLNLNGVNIVPDFIGYILIAIGSARLVPLFPEFQAAVIVAWIMAPLSLTEHSPIREAPVAFLIMIVTTVLHTILIWKLCEGVARGARDRGRSDLADFALLTRNLYITFLIAGVFIGLVGHEMGSGVLLLLIPMLIFVIVVIVMLCMMCVRAGRYLGPADV